MVKDNQEKLTQLMKYSNPLIVFQNALNYYGKDVLINISTRKDKKYMIYNPINNEWIHFGSFSPPMEDFTYHNDLKRRDNYLKRSEKIKGNWKDSIYSPNELSRILLWNLIEY
jgi:hypothetical protein